MLLSVRLQTKWLWFKSLCSYLRKSDISNFEKKADFHDKLKNINKNVISKKTKHVLVEKELNELSKKVKAISTKGLTKDLINKFSILNRAKYFLQEFQNYLVFILAKKYNKYCSGTTWINSWKSNKGIVRRKY